MGRSGLRRGLAATVGAATGLAAIPLALATPAAAVPGTGAAVFVNEFHYDNDGTDTGEFIEVAGPAGTALSGWSLVLYNGATPGAATTYGTIALGGTIPDQAGGYGTVAFPATGLQNGPNDGFALVNGTTVVQLLSYEGTFTAAAGPASGQTSTDVGVSQPGTTPAGSSIALTGDGTVAGDFAWAATTSATPGAVNGGQTFDGVGGGEPPAPACDAETVTPVSAVQGSGSSSPLAGRTVTVEAVVTAVHPGLGSFYVQEEAADSDGDPATSEGIAVFHGSAAPGGVAVGDLVQVTGRVSSFQQQDQLASPTVVVCDADAAPITPTAVTFPLAHPSDLERVEGMLVELADELVISEYFNYDRFGEVVVAKPLDGQDRLWTPTSVVEPGPEAVALAAEYAKRRITVDDASSRQNPSSVPHPGNGAPFSLENRFRGGDAVTGLQGVVDHTFGLYRVQPTVYGEYEAVNPRPTEAPSVGGTVTVASFNVLNYFLTLDTGPDVCGAHRNLECRGADDATELKRQRDKLLAALAELDADVVGLMEMENTPGVEPAADLAEGLNEELGTGTYSWVDTGVVGTDAIRVGYLYKPGSVTPVGEHAVLDSSVDGRFDDTKNRPMVTQTFDEVLTGERFTVSVNHLKSKGSSCADVGDPDAGDGSGNCNGTRTLAAEAIVDFLATDPTGSGDPDQLVIGDLNSYDKEQPIDVLVEGGYTDLVRQYGGETAYGYVFDGQAGYLDHALSSPTLTRQVTGTSEWHVNADEPDLLDYDTSFKPPAQDAIYAPDAYRSSDHDPVLVGLDLFSVQACYADGVQSVADFQPGSRANGAPVAAGQADPASALGLPDPQDEEAYWTTLGLGGEVTIEFARPVRDLDGSDLRLHDVDDGAKGRGDAAEVLALDGEQWVPVGEVTGTGEVDLASAGLASTTALRIVDTTPDAGPPAVDGYDLDAVEVLSGCG
ncbi:MAG: ExeM/NucH family extracellular endonuclease [Actinomycetes bacterium]